MMPDAETHQCMFRETFVSGRKMLGPCEVCGTPASQMLMALEGDQIRGIVARFLAESEDFARQAREAGDSTDRERYVGHSLARDILAKRLLNAGVSVASSPAIRWPARPAGARTAAAVRALHVLETVDVGDMRLSSCKADGHVSDDLTKNPCPTLAALDETDPPPLPPFADSAPIMAAVATILAGAFADHRMPKTDGELSAWVNGHEDLIRDLLAAAIRIKVPPPPPPEPKPVLPQDQLTTVIHKALSAALCNGGVPGWSLYEEAVNAADKLAETAPVLDLNSDETRKAILNAIASPTLYANRNSEAVPGHQARAVVEALRRTVDR